LSTVEGSLQIALPVITDRCGDDVDSCAHEFEMFASIGCSDGGDGSTVDAASD
jgi:hypothetical protein